MQTGQWSRDANEPPFIDLVPPERVEGERKVLYGRLQGRAVDPDRADFRPASRTGTRDQLQGAR